MLLTRTSILRSLSRLILVTTSLVSCFLGAVADGEAQTPSGWLIHDLDRPQRPIVKPATQALPVPAPADARVLFDGSDLSQWASEEGGPAPWVIRDGYMESVPDSGRLVSADGFGDIQLHVEWAAPAKPAGQGQGRGNSGVFLMGKYEVQVLDSYQNETYADGQAAAIYGQYPPLVNACLPPGEWQAYDIVFRRPRFGQQGTLLAPAKLTVIHNGIVVHIDRALWGPTAWLRHFSYASHPDRLPLVLQDHGNPVRYRNIWLRELPEIEEAGPTTSVVRPYVSVPLDVMEKYVGSYGLEDQSPFEISLDEGQLRLCAWGRIPLELVPAAKNEFFLRHTAGKVVFHVGVDGQVHHLEFYLGGKTYVSQRILDDAKQ